MRRTKNFDEKMSKHLRKNRKNAQDFIEDLMEGDDAYSPENALKHTIKVMGIKEFSNLSDIPVPRVVEFTQGRRKLKPETLDDFLKPFGLKTKIIFEKVA